MRTLRPDCALLVVALLCAHTFFGQAPSTGKPDQAPAGKYAAESVLIESSNSVYSMAADGTGWRQRTVAAKVQSDAAVRQLGVIGIPFAGSSERVEIQYARVRRADGTVIETPVTDALEMPDEVTRAAPFYSDLKQKQIPIRNLRVGDTLEWQARIVRTKAEAPGEFWGVESFIEDGVVLEQTIELRVPVSKKVTVWSPGHKPVESVAGSEHVYRWESSQTKPTTGPEAEAKKKAVWTPEQEADAKDGKLPGIAWTTFPSWEAVGAWYRGLEGDRMDPGPEVKAKVAEVTAGKTTEEEKVRAVYGYVATQIRYIGVAFGVGRYQPHRAAEVLENQYGDCKDKHTLLAAMLGALGLKANAVLIGAGVRFNPDVPSPMAFNHLITQVPVGGQTVWLDATAEVAPYRMLVAVIRDHPALVIPEVGVARVERTPAGLPFKPFQTMDAVGALDKDGVSKSRMTLSLRGDDEVMIRAILRQVPPAQYDQLVQNMAQGVGFGGTASHAEIGRAEDTVDPLTIRFEYTRDKAGDWGNFRTLAQLGSVSLPMLDEKEPPLREVALGMPRVETSTSAMKLPDGWGAELPEAIHARSAYANLDLTYRFEKGTLYAERKVEVLAQKVPVADWKSYKKFTDDANLGNELYVQLTHPKCDGCGKPGDARKDEKQEQTNGSNSKAADLVKEAYDDVGRHELDAAQKLLDQAKALNDTQAWLWATYGLAAFQHGEVTEAIRDYEKELLLHPDTYGIYFPLATANRVLGNKTETVAVLRRWVAAEPGSPFGTSALVNELIVDDDPKGALAAAEAGIAGLPEEKRQNEAVVFALGNAQLKAGQKEKGGETLESLLKTTQNTSLMNSAAYELSVAGERLEAAENGARAALAKMEDESKTWTLDENLAMLRGKTQMIAATWDRRRRLRTTCGRPG